MRNKCACGCGQPVVSAPGAHVPRRYYLNHRQRAYDKRRKRNRNRRSNPTGLSRSRNLVALGILASLGTWRDQREVPLGVTYPVLAQVNL